MSDKQFELLGGSLCLDFLNTIHEYGAPDPKEELHNLNDLIFFEHQAGAITQKEASLLSRSAASNPTTAGKTLDMVKDCRLLLFRIFAAIAHAKAPQEKDLNFLNQHLARVLQNLRLRKKGQEIEWVWRDDHNNLERILWPIVRSAAEVLTSVDRQLVRECGSQTCTWLFLDRSKNRTRRWCDMKTCGNRAKWRRFYSKNKKRIH